MDYTQLLKKARESLPKDVLETQRFEIPKVVGHIQGNKTIINNFQQIADVIRRPVEHLLKYTLKELATPGELKKGTIIIGSKVGASRINEKIRQYVKEYVICKECGKPDTKVSKEENIDFLRCMACGAKHPIKSKI